jgi:hypothetical protein
MSAMDWSVLVKISFNSCLFAKWLLVFDKYVFKIQYSVSVGYLFVVQSGFDWLWSGFGQSKITDSFRVGEDGCTNNASVWTISATCQFDGSSCLCSGSKPNFRNPNIIVGGNVLKYGDSYGCVSSDHLRFGVGSK